MFAKLPLRLYDPGFRNTAVCFSKISNTDNDKLLYRGYNVEELVDKSSFLEVSYLLIYGSLPSHNQYREYVYNVLHHTYLHSELEHQMSAFRYDSHPMAMLISSIASLSTFHPEANPAINGENMYLYQKDSAQNSSVFNSRQKAIFRMLGKIPTIAANAFRLRQGRSFNPPMPTNNYCENILYMMDKMNDLDYRPNPQLVRILDKLFIILAENQSTCSTVMIRHLASSGVDPYTALSGAAGALFGERKSTVIIQMLTSLEKNANVATFLDSIANPSGKRPKLYGFGHVVYKTDPRANMAKKLLLELIELTASGKLTEVAFELERQVALHPWFIERNLHPNIDFWTALIVHNLDFPTDMFPVWMFLPRVAGLIAHWIESIDDPEFKIFRPRQIYIGHELRNYTTDKKDRHGKRLELALNSETKAVTVRGNRQSLKFEPSYKLESLSTLKTVVDEIQSTLLDISNGGNDDKIAKIATLLNSANQLLNNTS